MINNKHRDMSNSKYRRLTSSPEKDPLNLLETTPNKHPRQKKHSFDGEIISTSLSPINLNIQKNQLVDPTRKIKNSSLLSLSTTGNNSTTASHQQLYVTKKYYSTVERDEDDTIEGDDILDRSPINIMKNKERSPRTIKVPLAKEDDGLNKKRPIRNGTPARRVVKKVFELNNNDKADDSEFESEDDDLVNNIKDTGARVPNNVTGTPLDSYKFPSVVTSTVLSKGKKRLKREVEEEDDDLDTKEQENVEQRKKRQATTPRTADESVDISDTLSKASIFISMKKKELQHMQEEKTVPKDTTGKILNFEEEAQEEEEEDSDELMTKRFHEKHEDYHLLKNWKSSKWNKLIKFLKIYQITKNDEMLSAKSIRQRFECDLDEIKLRIMILNQLNERKKRL